MTAPKRVAIIGGGPSGSALATFCARAGHQVTVFERHMPAVPVVGESLLPFGNRVLDLLGMSTEGFVEKSGALFVRGEQAVRYDFEESQRPLYTRAHQVERSVFDQRLREVAQHSGVTFCHQEVSSPPPGFDWVVDATGRRRVLGRRWTTYAGHPQLKNAAVARHYLGVRRPEGAAAGDITIFSFDGGWFWLIPLRGDLTSVGLVTTPSRRGLKFDEAVGQCDALGELLRDATSTGDLSGHRDFTEYAERFCGPGWALVGDAALFLDPVFSSGVLFALEGAERLARVIDGRLSPEEYEREMRAAASLIEPLILGFYSGDFFDLGFVSAEHQEPALRKGVVSLLAGDVFDGAPRMAQVVSRRLADLAFRIRRSNAEATLASAAKGSTGTADAP